MTHGAFLWELQITYIPEKIFSIVWTDSIPIYSIFLKIIYNLTGFKLTNPLSIWYFICYVLFSYYLGKVLQLQQIVLFAGNYFTG